MTIREAIRTYRGSFYKALLQAHEQIGKDVQPLFMAYRRADRDHERVLEDVLPGLKTMVAHWFGAEPRPHARHMACIAEERWGNADEIRAALERGFPGLKALDEHTEIPTAFDLLVEQPARQSATAADVREFVGGGMAAQAAVDQVIAEHEAGEGGHGQADA